MGKIVDIKGQKFNRLTVLEYVEKSKWLCKCDCGNEKVVSGGNLRTGNTTSCGCFFREALNHRNNVKHGKMGTRLYGIWIGLRRRCRDKKYHSYKRYGERGITVCKEWEDYENFYNWAMSSGYSDDLTIDRIDNNKGYEPSNCRWATQKQQANNKSNNTFYTVYGEILTLAQIADKYKIKYDTLHKRVKLYNWDIEKAVETPINTKYNRWKKKDEI